MRKESGHPEGKAVTVSLGEQRVPRAWECSKKSKCATVSFLQGQTLQSTFEVIAERRHCKGNEALLGWGEEGDSTTSMGSNPSHSSCGVPPATSTSLLSSLWAGWQSPTNSLSVRARGHPAPEVHKRAVSAQLHSLPPLSGTSPILACTGG